MAIRHLDERSGSQMLSVARGASRRSFLASGLMMQRYRVAGSTLLVTHRREAPVTDGEPDEGANL